MNAPNKIILTQSAARQNITTRAIGCELSGSCRRSLTAVRYAATVHKTKMGNHYYIFIILFFTTIGGCNHSTEQSNNFVVPNYRPDYPISETLSVPKLSIGIGIETGDVHISWTAVDSINYYELEQSFGKDFLIPNLEYAGVETSLPKSPTSINSFYRVRAIYNWKASKWSNIVHH